MATIPLPLASKTLQDLKMLGSHDAGMGYFANAISFREGAMVTQMTHLVTQANCGVRAFDFRIGTYKRAIGLRKVVLNFSKTPQCFFIIMGSSSTPTPTPGPAATPTPWVMH